MISYLDALAEITSWTEASSFPVLTAAELDDLVVKARREDAAHNPPDEWREWVAGTAYAVGDVVVPSDRDPKVYFTVTIAGTSDATTEPDWPATIGDTVVDNDITWEVTDMAPWTPTYNLAYGIQMGWIKKRGKLIGAYDIASWDQKLSRSQMIEHVKGMIQEWKAKAGAGSQIELKGSMRNRNLFEVETSSTPDIPPDDFFGPQGPLWGSETDFQWTDSF